MKKQRLDENLRPLPYEIVRFKDMGNIKEVMYSKHKNTKISILRIDKDNYIDLSTGELKEFNHLESRADDKNIVRVTLGKLRDIINTNVTDVTHCKWITLTYAENMTDTKRLYNDFKKFNMRFAYRYSSYHYEYIVVMEPQGRGAWHAHLIIIFDDVAPFIPNDELSKIWRNGFVKVKALDNVDNIGAYLTAYLGDMELSEYVDLGYSINPSAIKTVEITDENGNKVSKRILKGARLNLYPPKFNIYRCSRGIKKPDTVYMREKEAQEALKKVGATTPTYERTTEISEGNFSNIFNYRQFNIKRIEKQE